MIRYLTLRHVFAEPSPGRIAHTPSSRQLVTSEHVRSWVDVRTEETGPAAFGLVAASKRWGTDSQELEQTAFSHVHSDGELSRFGLLALPENRHREIRFAKLMKALQATEPYDLKHTVNGYDWEGLGDQALVVDVGGSSMAATAQAIVRAFPNLTVIVQE
jgi:6-hydroxytryprostatin B O-methyltransferase